MKTDNSHIKEKVALRKEAIKNYPKPKILDCFAGDNYLWNKVEKQTKKDLQILRIEKQDKKNSKAHLQGDNLKYLPKMNFSEFNIVDLDAYGIPFNQLEIIFNKGFKGIVIVTAIQSVYGKLPKKMLYELGYTDKMINKIPTLFYKNGIDKLKNYLYIRGVKEITGYFLDRKNYFMFKL